MPKATQNSIRLSDSFFKIFNCFRSYLIAIIRSPVAIGSRVPTNPPFLTHKFFVTICTTLDEEMPGPFVN